MLPGGLLGHLNSKKMCQEAQGQLKMGAKRSPEGAQDQKKGTRRPPRTPLGPQHDPIQGALGIKWGAFFV